MDEKFKRLPKQLQNLIHEPNYDPPIFSNLNPRNAASLATSVRTHTLLSLLKPEPIHHPEPVFTAKPIILVFCQPSEEICIDRDIIFPYVPISYANWIQGAGGRCVPLPYNINEGSMEFLLERSHGLVLPGGGSNLYENFFKKEGRGAVMIGFLKVWRLIQKMWAKGVYYPIWGTCLGFEMMLIALTNDTKVLSNLNSRGHQLEIYSNYDHSKILKKMPLNLRFKAENYKLINFQHSYGISVQKFLSFPKLMQRLKITQISRDKDGKWFCSALEGKDSPIFITQYHPEKQAYQWTKNGDIKHTQDSIQISQYYATSFINQCRKCRSVCQFSSSTEQLFYYIQNYKQIHTPQKLYKVYAIDFKYRDYDKEARKEIKTKRSNSIKPSQVKQPFI